MELDSIETLAGELQRLRRGGNDESDLLAYIANRAGVREADAQLIYDSFERGSDAGTQSVFEPSEELFEWAASESEVDRVFAAAYQAAIEDAIQQQEETRRLVRSRGRSTEQTGGNAIGCVMFAIGIIIAILRMLMQ